MKISTSSIVALAVFTAAPAWAICTPAQVNEAAQRRIVPGMTMASAIAAIGCAPKDLVPSPQAGGMLASWTVVGLGEIEGGGLHVFFDGAGAAFTIYFPPLAVSAYSGQLRGFPGVTPPWLPSAGVIAPMAR